MGYASRHREDPEETAVWEAGKIMETMPSPAGSTNPSAISTPLPTSHSPGVDPTLRDRLVHAMCGTTYMVGAEPYEFADRIIAAGWTPPDATGGQ